MLVSVVSIAAFAATALAMEVPGDIHPFTTSQLKTSKAFILVAALSDSPKDLTPSIDTWVVATTSVDSATTLAILVPGGNSTSPPLHNDAPSGRIFYLNGTVEEVNLNSAHVLTDTDNPLATWGLDLITNVSSPGEKDVYVNIGQASVPSGVTTEPDGKDPVLIAGGGTQFAACMRWVVEQQTELVTVQAVTVTLDPPEFDPVFRMPEGCVGIYLKVQCATVTNISRRDEANHGFVQEVNCLAP